MKKCSRCKKEKSIEEFNFKIQAVGLRQLQCKECTRLLIRNHYIKNKEYYLNKAKYRNNKIKLEVTNYLTQYFLKNPCIDCGKADLAVLEFDHKGEIPKFMAVSSIIRHGYPLDKIKDEINKCVV